MTRKYRALRNRYIGPGTQRPGNLGARPLVLLVLWLIFAIYVAFGSLPSNPISLPYARTLRIEQLAPQGWSFFTKSPRDEQVETYRLVDHQWHQIGPLSQRDYLWGLTRTARSRGAETGLIVSGIPNEAWTDCEFDISSCLDQAQSAGLTVSRYPNPALCGDVAFALRRPTPWAWRDLPRLTMPARVARWEVTC